MSAFLFGPSAAPLFGIHHAAAAPSRAHGVLICPPYGAEYMQTHYVARRTAQVLASSGLDVLRFDYGCTGDSAGDMADADLDRWREDVSMAIDELRDLAPVRRITVVGFRLGAAIALQATCSGDDVALAVLWEPVLDGGLYLRHLASIADVPLPAGDRIAWLFGAPFGPTLRRQLVGLDVRPLLARAGGRVAFVVADGTPLAAHALESRPSASALEIVPADESVDLVLHKERGLLAPRSVESVRRLVLAGSDA
jgi:alpha/beta superfamily hydrolase